MPTTLHTLVREARLYHHYSYYTTTQVLTNDIMATGSTSVRLLSELDIILL